MKRFISLILIIVISAVPVQLLAYNDVDGSYKRAIDFVSLAGIMRGDADGNFHANDMATRAEAAAILCKLSGIDHMSAERMASDIDADSWAYQYVNAAIKFGLMKNSTAGKFEPDGFVSYNDIKNSLMMILGYSKVTGSRIAIEAENALLKNVGISGNNITRAQLAQVVYNALYIKIVEEKFTNNSKDYEVSDKTLLESYLEQNNMTLYRGILEVTHTATMTADDFTKEGYVIISGVKYLYEDSADLTNLIGRRVSFSVEDDESSIPKVSFITGYRNTEYSMEADDIVLIDKNTVKYDTEKGEEKLSFANNAVYIYNNRLVPNISASDMLVSNGTYTFVDNDEDEIIDVIIVKAYVSYIVKNISEPLAAIYFMNNRTYLGRNNIVIDSEANAEYKCTLVDADGKNIELTDIEPYDAVTIIGDKSRQQVQVQVSKTKVYGYPSQISDEYVVIDDKEYKVGRDENGIFVYNCTIGTIGNYIIDAYGNIVGFEETGESKKYAYVAAMDTADSLGNFQLKLVIGGKIEKVETDVIRAVPKYMVGNKALEIYTAASNIKINNQKMSYSEARSLLNGAFITYQINSNGEISKIDVLSANMSLIDRAFNPDILSFGGLFYIDQNTTVVCHPLNSDAVDEDYFTVLTIENTQRYRILGYDIDPETKIAKAVYINEQMKLEEAGVITKSTKSTVVEKISRVIYNDEATYLMKVWSNGSEQNLYSSGNGEVDQIIGGLKFGDVIYYSTNSLGFVDNVEYVASLEGASPFERNLRSDNECIYGTLYTLSRLQLSTATNTQVNTFGISLAGNGTDVQEYTVDNTKMPKMYFIDMGKKTVTAVTIQDLAPYNEFGEDGVKLFIAKKFYTVSSIVAVK